MKTHQIEIGGRYLAKVAGRVVPVVVLATHEQLVRHRGAVGGVAGRTAWSCRNEVTGRTIAVRSPQRFRGPAPAAVNGEAR